MIDVPDDWRAACDAVGAAGWRRVMVVGPNGAGKSTFCRLLAESCGAALLDADIGQQEAGPPGAVSLTRGAATVLYFVGTTSPMANLMGLLAGTARLAHAGAGERLVCNTSGLVGGPGVALKTFKADAIQAEALVILAPGDEAAAVAAAHRHLPILFLRPSPLARRRSPAERRAARAAGFARHLAGAEDRVFAEAVRQRRPPDPDLAAGTLCGLADGAGTCLGIGLLQSLTPLTVWTPVTAGVRLVQFGEMRLARDGAELGPARR